eukprot:Gregarina_sp_Poly_1__3749@NODE_210_length_11350_cov_52_014358_g187_i0_p4_GENE_NODE_210_length_11350_cov_52_014358_g187_i0NODE_210_length_11350_cov_52_014358_g187_i0_p4_ORF_typecomplete_len577_score91_86RRM_1/PF00076_22/0_031RRM_1/PF00076_22/1e12RRM_5/PF13893_6/3_8RRM_5/PF13893_6/0_016Nup35_RRM_2/PF14605_6/3_7e03Nup35_RRM_2/PF14605_6/0_00068RRM_occluded/PF16842_5/4RRM_occluded/PF16842_5/2_4DUF4523/PF15023_6/0_18DUF4523/PF15023_6/63RRM_2/PF04059_12/3e02RRM_2/PF04059_12/0_95RRM_7/PF16367_5/3_7e02RR
MSCFPTAIPGQQLCVVSSPAPSTPQAALSVPPQPSSFQLPSSLTPVSEEVYSESDLALEADSASVAEAETEAAPTEAVAHCPAAAELNRKRSAQSLEEPSPATQTFCINFNELPPGSMFSQGGISADKEDQVSETALMQPDVHGYQTGAVVSRTTLDNGRPPQKRARPSLSDAPVAVNRAVFIDPYLQPAGFAPRTSSGGLNIAPRANRRGKRRAVSKGPWAAALKQLLPVLKAETLATLLLSACERHHPTAEAVRQALASEPAGRRLAVRNVPYSLTAAELVDALESAFGAVLQAAVSNKGNAVVVFEHFESAFHAAFGHALPQSSDAAPIPEAFTSLSVRGRQLQFRYLPSGDPTWDILYGGPGIDVLVRPDPAIANSQPAGAANRPVTKTDGNSSSAAQVGPRRNRQQGHGSRRRRTTELLVRDLSPSTNETALASAFAHFGDIRRVYVPTDARGCPRGHGFVTFHKQEDALRAAQQTQRLIGDQLAFVSLAGADPHRTRRLTGRQPPTSDPRLVSQNRRRGRNRTSHARGKVAEFERQAGEGVGDGPMSDDSPGEQMPPSTHRFPPAGEGGD